MSRLNEPNMPQGEQSQQSGGVGQTVRDVGSKISQTAQEQFQSLRDSASQYYEQGKEKAMEWEQSLESYVRDQPMKSILIAAGVGMLLGIIWRRS